MEKTVTLLDGGMGQELIRRSGKPPTPLWSAQVMLDAPELVEDLHLEFIDAGAKIIALNNYTATPARLRRDADFDLFAPIHNAAKQVAQSAVRKSGKPDVKIAGCLPPLVASYKPELVPEAEDCLAQYRELVNIQKDGIDLMFCETMATIREAMAAASASTEAGLDTVVSFTLDDDNPLTLRSGELLVDAIEAVRSFNILGITINCSSPEAVDTAMPRLSSQFSIVGGYANGFQSIDTLEAGGTTEGLKARKDLTPKIYAQHALGWAEMGAKIIGGCCEVGPAHIAEIDSVLRASGFTIRTL